MPHLQSSTGCNGLRDLPFGSGYAAFGCAVNTIDVDTLFSKYKECGFLYPAKMQRLAPYWNLIKDNWARTMSSPDGTFLHDVVVYNDPSNGAWASITYWATTNHGGHAQHLVSVGRPEASRAVMLACQSEIANGEHNAIQNWFRAENRFPARVFGSCAHSLGVENAVIHQHVLIGIDRSQLPSPDRKISVHRATDSDASALDELSRHICGEVQARADDWASGDIELSTLDKRFQAVGLRRYRKVVVANAPGLRQPAGFAVAYRGPLGLNFSFLENRCELWLDPQLNHEQHIHVAASLIDAASRTYDDSELPSILITTNPYTASVLTSMGAALIQDYSRSVWLRPGYAAWYGHVNSFYTRIIAAANRRSTTGTNGVFA